MRGRWHAFSIPHDGLTHYFLRHRGGRLILDPARFECEAEPSYDAATATTFISSWPCGRAHKIIERAGFEWPLNQGDSICPICRGGGENPRVFCEGCGRLAVCLSCLGTGIRQQHPAIELATY
jgi:hypothetical protein